MSHHPDAIVEALEHLLADDTALAGQLEQSFTRAHARAEADLDREIFGALDWPRSVDEYTRYLRRFVRWIPTERGEGPWRAGGRRSSQEVADRLAHFFWLVDQPTDGEEQSAAESSEPFRDWLTRFASEWGSFLDTPESFTPEILAAFLENGPEYTVEESLVNGRPNQPSGWTTFNQFFARDLNAGLRPIADPADNRVVVSPADCSFVQCFGIDEQSNIPATKVKGDTYGNIAQLLGSSRHANAFAGGTFAHYMLPPTSYHRYHVPVSGRVEEAFVIPGRVFMEVELVDGELQGVDAADSGYEFSQTRGVLVIDTAASAAGDIGLVAIVPVGMGNVASVTVTPVEGTTVAKGDEFGFFQFGGSDIILVFQPGVDVAVDPDTSPRKVGSVAARCS